MSQEITTLSLSKAITSGDGFHHLVYSISGTTHTLFLDNSAIAVNISGGNVFSTYQNITNLFCGIAGDLSYGYTGYIDDFKVFNRALTTIDVSAIYNSNSSGISAVLGPIDKLSTAAKAAMLYSGTGATLSAGAYGITLLNSKYTGPSIQIKNGSSGTPTDFYSALDGTPTLKTISGTTLTSFLAGTIAYVTKWYDQTGNGKHATAQGATLPFLNTTTFVVDFGSVGYFSLLDGSFPTGNLPYTYLYKHGTVTQNTCTFSGGIDNGQGRFCMLYFPNHVGGIVASAWSGFDMSTLNIPSNNSVICTTYGGGGNNINSNGRFIYVNNVNQSVSIYGSSTRNRDQPSSNCYLGYRPVSPAVTYKTTMPYFYWLPYQLNASDIEVLGST